ncbi:MAG: hypothetical protein R3Y44_03230 [Rikenellaceae bacterium]
MIMLLNSAWTWSEILWIALIGFLLVLSMLLALVVVMKIFGKISVAASKSPDLKVELQPQLSGEEIAAIATALRMHMGERHDRESAILTIMSIKRAYSPWSAKIHGLTQLPLRK